MKPKLVLAVHWLVGYLAGAGISYAYFIKSSTHSFLFFLLMVISILILKKHGEKLSRLDMQLRVEQDITQAFYKAFALALGKDAADDVFEKVRKARGMVGGGKNE